MFAILHHAGKKYFKTRQFFLNIAGPAVDTEEMLAILAD